MFGDFPTQLVRYLYRTFIGQLRPGSNSHLIGGGEPEGISILTGVSGCRITSTSIRRITVMGNNKTTPSGMDIDEFPFNRIRRRRKANRGDNRVFERSSSEGIFDLEGKRW